MRQTFYFESSQIFKSAGINFCETFIWQVFLLRHDAQIFVLCPLVPEGSVVVQSSLISDYKKNIKK